MTSLDTASSVVLQRQDRSTEGVLDWISKMLPVGRRDVGAAEIAMLLTPLGWETSFPDPARARGVTTAVVEGRVVVMEYEGGPYAMQFRREGVPVPSGVRIAAMDILVEGAAVLVQGDQREQLGPGALIIHPPQGDHRIEWQSDHVRRMTILITTRVFGQLTGPVLRTSDIAVHDAPLAPAMLALASELLTPSDTHLAAAAGRALEELVNATVAAAIDHSRRAPTNLRARIREQLLARHHEANLDANEIARALRISRRHLFAQYDGAADTFASELRRIRLTHAAEILASPDENITVRRVAKTTGFSSAEQLTRVFREHYGVPPSAYRAQTLAAAGAPHANLRHA